MYLKKEKLLMVVGPEVNVLRWKEAFLLLGLYFNSSNYEELNLFCNIILYILTFYMLYDVVGAGGQKSFNIMIFVKGGKKVM